MEKNRESRGGIINSGRLPWSRRRGSSFREPSGAGEVEGRGNESSRNRSNDRKEYRSSRRRLNSNGGFYVDREEEADGSTDESLDVEHEEEDEHLRIGTSLRRTSRAKPRVKGTDEMIGVSVPRKARSASVKRLQDSFLQSSPARASPASVSPPSSNATTKFSKRTVSISESEVEVAQFLYGLTRLHPLNSARDKQNAFEISSQTRHSSSNKGAVVASKGSSSVSTPIFPPASPIPSATVKAPKRKKPKPAHVEDRGGHAMQTCISRHSQSETAMNSISSVTPATKTKEERDSKATKPEVLSPKAAKSPLPSASGSSRLVSTPLVPLQKSMPRDPLEVVENSNTSSSLEPKPLVGPHVKLHLPASLTTEKGATEANSQASASPIHHIILEQKISSQDLPASLTPDVEPDASKIGSPVSAASQGVKNPKFEIDLMASPGNSYLDDSSPDFRDGSEPGAPESETSLVTVETRGESQGINSLTQNEETKTIKQKHEINFQASEEKIHTGQTIEAEALEKNCVHDKKSELPNDENQLDKKNSQKLPKAKSREVEITVPPVILKISKSEPDLATMTSWPGSVPLGYHPGTLSGLPSFQGANPVERDAAIPKASFVRLPQARPNRCATHFFITQLISYQQQLAKLNPFWHAVSSATLYGAKPYNFNILPPQSESLFLGGSIIRNPNLRQGNSLGSYSAANLKDHNSKEKSAISVTDSQRKQQHVIPRSAQRGAAFIHPVNQLKTGVAKSATSAENACLKSASLTSSCMNVSVSKISATSSPQYLTMPQGKHNFPVPASYRAHINQQQQLVPPVLNGSFCSSHFLQLQAESIPRPHNPASSTRFSSSQKSIQAQQKHWFPASNKLPPESNPEAASPTEEAADTRILYAQKKPHNQNISGSSSCNISSSPPNLAIMAAALGGKQQVQQTGDTSPQMRNRLNAPANCATASSKLESNITHSTATAAQQLQQQPIGGTSTTDSTLASCSVRIPVVYSNTGVNFQVGSMAFPYMQASLHGKMPSVDRVGQAGSLGNSFDSSTETVAGSLSSAGKLLSKGLSSPLNSCKNAKAPGLASAQSTGSQSVTKSQQLFANSKSAEKRQIEQNFTGKTIVPGSLNMRRPANNRIQPGTSASPVAGHAYLAGGTKGQSLSNPLGGGSMTVMAAVSYAPSAANLPVQSAEQNQTTS